MKLTYEISKLALNDIQEIWEHTAYQWSKQQANKYFNEIFTSINKICLNPESGASIDHIKFGHKRKNIKSHMIIYKIRNEIIYIDRVLHQKMDIERHIND